MSDENARLLDVLVATYNNVGDAEADLKAIRGLYDKLGTSHNFDAAVISKNENGKVKINESYEAGTRHASLKGLASALRPVLQR
jgi:uncharacterized membrane protein